jgi:hypothetical protein
MDDSNGAIMGAHNYCTQVSANSPISRSLKRTHSFGAATEMRLGCSRLRLRKLSTFC